MSKNRERDLKILKKILDYQKEIIYSLKKNKIQFDVDLTEKLEYMTRRGIIQTVGDIFELTKTLTEETSKDLELNQTIIKRFRDWSSHQYSSITDEVAFAIISYITSKDVLKRMKDEIGIIKEELNK